MNKLLCLFLLAMMSVFVNAQFCKYTDSKGRKYDFSPMKGKDYRVDDAESNFFFMYRFCDVVTYETECASNKGSLCAYQSVMPKALLTTFARWTEDKQPTVTGDKETGLRLTFKNGDPYSGQVPTFIMNIACGTANTPTIEQNGVTITMTMTNPIACPSGSGADDSGLSGGAIFLIVLASVIPVYILLGCIYNIKVKQMSFGINACPQKAFWFSLPGLVKDGAIFTYQKLRGCCSGNKASSSGGYDEGYGTMA